MVTHPLSQGPGAGSASKCMRNKGTPGTQLPAWACSTDVEGVIGHQSCGSRSCAPWWLPARPQPHQLEHLLWPLHLAPASPQCGEWPQGEASQTGELNRTPTDDLRSHVAPPLPSGCPGSRGSDAELPLHGGQASQLLEEHMGPQSTEARLGKWIYHPQPGVGLSRAIHTKV